MAKKIYVGDFLRQVKEMEEACDQYGVKLYSREDIASAFGFVSVNNLDNKIKEARKIYRDDLKEKVRRIIKEDGIDNYDQIAEKFGLNVNTIRVLLNKDYDDYSEKVQKMEDERNKLFNSINDQIKFGFGIF